MTKKENYSPEEWQLLQETLSLSGLLVIFASPLPNLRGAASLLKETNALYQSLTRMLSHGAAFSLIDELRLDLRHQAYWTGEGKLGGQPLRELTPEQVRKLILDRCRQVSQLLYQKAEPEEALYYKKGLLWVCLQIARATNEHRGLFGSGGPAITEDEFQAIRQVAFALGLSAVEPLVEELPAAPRRSLPTQLGGLINLDEWQILREAPVWVSAAVLMVSPSGVLGTLREITTLVRTLRNAGERFPDNRLIDALVDDLGILASVGGESPLGPDANFSPQQALENAVRACQQVTTLLRAKGESSEGAQGERVRQEGREYKEMLLELARQVAESAREGGFLGIGSKRVSAEEQSLINALEGALDL